MTVTGRWLLSGAMTAALAGLASPAIGQESNDAAIAALIAESAAERALVLAREQTATGDLLGAAATLERVLLADPNAHEARLLYAATLCRLGDPQGARIEVAKLSRQAVSDSAWDEANRACGNDLARPAPAAAATAASGLSGEAYVGVAYDRDAGGALALQFVFAGDEVERDDGASLIAGLRLDYRSPGYASGGGLYASASGSAKHDVAGPDLEYRIGEARAGFGAAGGRATFGFGGVARHLRLLGDPYVTELGGQGELLLGNSAPRRLRLRAEAVHQNYLTGFPGDAADGMRFDLSAAIEATVGSQGLFALGLAGEAQNADLRTFAYRGGRLFAVTQLPGAAEGHYVNLSGTLRYIDFRDDPPTVDRTETRGFVRAAYGLPLLRQLYLEAAGSYTLRSAKFSDTAPFSFSIDPARYRSIGAEARLITRF